MSTESTAIKATETSGDVRALIESIAKALVEAPDAVEVRAVEEDQSTIVELRVAQGDVGKVIGKQGRTVRAMRAILGAAGLKLHRRFTLEILE